MNDHHNSTLGSAIFITFSGNCRKALTYYQSCFGGTLQLETFPGRVRGGIGKPVISGSLVSDRIVMYGSDLVHEEGRITGNYMAVFLRCRNGEERQQWIRKLRGDNRPDFFVSEEPPKLIELTDLFEVRWVLAI